jgi:FAD-dependent urate hydroxylase
MGKGAVIGLRAEASPGRQGPATDVWVAVIGAGPYGLSVAAHLRAAGTSVLVMGKPMESWQAMPRGMYLRSAWSASSLAAPGGRFRLDHYIRATGAAVDRPIPLRDFIDYGMWFHREAVGEVEETYVRTLRSAGSGFEIDLEDGRTLHAARVVVATGIREFARVPDFALDLPNELASHSQDHRSFEPFAGKNVAVVGGGQSALECAALLHEAGASVEVLSRREVIWLRFHGAMGLGRRLLQAPSDVGPPGLSWLIHWTRFFRLLPSSTRQRLTQRAVRPAGARWLQSRVEGHVRLTTNVEVIEAVPDGSGIHLRLSDGGERAVDHLLLGTGYRPHVDRLRFLDPSIRQQLRHRDGYPVLDSCFKSSVSGLHFVGAIADRSYGPICRFVSGAEPTARRVAAAVSRAA